MSDCFQLHATDGGVPQSRVRVDFDAGRHARKAFPGQGFTDGDIEALWQAKVASPNCRVFDASKFRLAKTTTSNDTVRLNVGLTSYKEMLGTHHSPRASDLTKVKDHGYDEPFPFSSNAMGIGVYPVTTDGFVPLIRCAAWKAEAPNKVDRIGGHPEPEQAVARAKITSSSALSADQVLEEIFDAPRAELRDEVNVSYSQQGEPLLIGEVRDVSIAGRVALEFVIHLKIDRRTVEEGYRSGDQAEADESTELLWLSVDKVKQWSFDSSDHQNLFNSMAVHCQGGLRLFQQYLLYK